MLALNQLRGCSYLFHHCPLLPKSMPMPTTIEVTASAIRLCIHEDQRITALEYE